MQIEVALDVYKALAAGLRHEGDSYSDLIRDMMGLDSPLEIEARSAYTVVADVLEDFRNAPPAGFTGFSSRGLHLPNGTKLRARYKGREYHADILKGIWTSKSGECFDSPSAAASEITKNNVNGLRFWEARLPNEVIWRRLDGLRR